MCDLLTALAAWLTSRRRDPGVVVLALGAGVGLPVIAVAGRHDAMPSSAVFVVLLFVWVGANFPRWTSLWLLPLAAAADLYTVGSQSVGPEGWLPPLLVTLVGCAVVAETIALSMARLAAAEADVRVRASELRTVVDAAALLNSLDTDVVLQTAVGTLLRLGHDAAAIALVEPTSGQLRFTHAEGLIPEGAADAASQGDGGVTGRALRLDTTIVETDYPAAPDALPAVVAAGFRTMIATPVRADGVVLGLLLCASKGPGSSTGTDAETVELLAAHVGRALRNATDYARQELVAAYHANQALLDPLTGIGNRRHAENVLAGLQPGDTVYLFDLDHFKNVNDTHGHAAGDGVLQDFARFLRNNIRYVDGLARMGGEEFLVVRRAAGPGRERVPRFVEAWRATDPLATVSAGVAIHRSDRTPQETLAAADAALYAAKGDGRDRAIASSA